VESTLDVHLPRRLHYALPFPAGSFDAAVAHAMLQHLAGPGDAMREIHRVLKPGGIVGISDVAWDRRLRYPTNPVLEAWEPLYGRAIARRGGCSYYGPSKRGLLRAAGFSRTEAVMGVASPAVGVNGAGTLAATRAAAQADIARLRDVVTPVALAEGWASARELDAMVTALAEWGDNPDACASVVRCMAIGWA
jgi:hypothetical protein